MLTFDLKNGVILLLGDLAWRDLELMTFQGVDIGNLSPFGLLPLQIIRAQSSESSGVLRVPRTQ